MGSLVIVDGDALTIVSAFGDHVVTITPPAKIVGSGKTTIGEKNVCIVGDELKVNLAATYVTPFYPVTGSGMVTIELDASQKAKVASDGSTPLITMGSTFIATFTATVPAQMPAPVSTPDPVQTSKSTGVFMPSQTCVMAD